MDDFILKRFALFLKTSQHASAAIQEHFALKQAVRKRDGAALELLNFPLSFLEKLRYCRHCKKDFQ